MHSGAGQPERPEPATTRLSAAAFTSYGGAAIRWKMGTDDIDDVTGTLKEWLGARAQAAGAR